MNEYAGDQTAPRPMLTDPNRPDLSTPTGIGALRSQVQHWAARGSTADAAKTTPTTEVDSTSGPQLAPTTTITTTGLPVSSAPNVVYPPGSSANVNAPSIPPVSNTLPSSQGNGGDAASSSQPGQVQYWNQTGAEYIAQVMPGPNGGWPQATPTPVKSQVMGAAGLLYGYNNGVPVPTPAHSQYGAVIPPTPTTTMAMMTPPPTRVWTVIPSYQNCTIGRPPVAGVSVGGGYPVFQPAGGMDPFDEKDVALLSESVRIPEPGGCADTALADGLSNPPMQYAQALPATATPLPTQNAPTPTGTQPMMTGAPPPPGGAPSTGALLRLKVRLLHKGTDSEWAAPSGPCELRTSSGPSIVRLPERLRAGAWPVSLRYAIGDQERYKDDTTVLPQLYHGGKGSYVLERF
ncbi:unnamed protein product [Phytophthora fragariaefolia]|uniref:Unnamed protein product n=1 Tax=Phytophthora fragariaefolia TaxID=1490495 RepID=A0A9W6Y444_9STRA|nr:unnamed protein product [Phytophthora fragariaefolia]